MKVVQQHTYDIVGMTENECAIVYEIIGQYLDDAGSDASAEEREIYKMFKNALDD